MSSISYIPGESNAIANALSCNFLETWLEDIGKLVALDNLVATKLSCSSISKLCNSSVLKIKLKKLPSGNSLLLDISTGAAHVLVPDSLKLAVTRQAHELHHPGICGTRCLISQL